MSRSCLGVFALLFIAWLCSENRRAIRWRTSWAAWRCNSPRRLMLIGIPGANRAMFVLNDAASALQRATEAGTGFVFGYLAGPPLPFAETHPGASFILAFQALPLVLTISALASLLFHWGILQFITGLFARLLRRALGIGGPLALGAAVHIFVGMIEAPLLVRPYLARMQRGELFALMTCGMAGVAGTVMVIYASFLAPVVPNALGNILIASVISTPAALAIAALMVPFDRPEPAEAEFLMQRQADRTDGCTGERHHGRRADPGGDHRHLAGDGGDGDAAEHGARAVAGLERRAGHACSGCSPSRSARSSG